LLSSRSAPLLSSRSAAEGSASPLTNSPPNPRNPKPSSPNPRNPKPSSRPERRTAVSSVAQWRDPRIRPCS
jgi:hypothetical protein